MLNILEIKPSYKILNILFENQNLADREKLLSILLAWTLLADKDPGMLLLH